MDSGQSIVYRRRYLNEWITEAIPLESVRLIQAEDKYIVVYHDNGEAVLSTSLYKMDDKYACLIRVSRKALVNINRVKSICSWQENGGRHGRVVLDVPGITPSIARLRWRGLWEAYRRVKENGDE